MTSVVQHTLPSPQACETLRVVGEVLDGLNMALCLFDAADRTLLWNRGFLRFFPEHDGHVHAGEPYAENLRRFYVTRLGETDPETLAQCIAEGVLRHRSQQQPFAFEHRGRWLRAASLPVPGAGRVRIWAQITPPPADGTDETEAQPFEGGTGDGWTLATAEGAITRANAGLAALFDLPAASGAQSLNLAALLRHAWRAADPAGLATVLRTLAEGERFVGVPFELALPGARWLRVLQRRTESGMLVSTFADITAMKRLQAELAEAREAAEEASRAKDALLATVSHELRTPLNALLELLGYLGEAGGAEEARRRLILAQEAAGGMLALVEDVLRFSELTRRGVVAEPVPTDIRALLDGVRDMLAPRAAEAGLSLEAAVAEAVPRLVLLDGKRLRQVLLNLLGNALKFTTRGSVSLTVLPAEGRLAIEVADTGIGIAAEAHGRIFEPFARAEEGGGRRHGGSGLGLAMSRALVEAMGGSIRVESEAGKGSRFRVLLPLRPVAAAAPPSRLPGLRVLVVDDQALNREVARLHLSTLGAAVSTAGDGETALRLCEGGFDVVLMDLDMPGMDGFDTARALRDGGGPSAGACLLALTAHAQEGYRRRAREAGLDGFVGKPVTARDLAAAIAAALLDPAITEPLREALAPDDWAGLVGSFEETAREALAALAAGEPARAPAHCLKGAAWNLGAHRLGDRAALLERLPPEAVPAALPALGRLLDASLAALRGG